MNYVEAILLGLTAVGALVASTATLVWFVSRQFSDSRALMYKLNTDLGEKLVNKLEYHEKHDDERFQSIMDRIWGMELRNAKNDGTIPPLRNKTTNHG